MSRNSVFGRRSGLRSAAAAAASLGFALSLVVFTPLPRAHAAGAVQFGRGISVVADPQGGTGGHGALFLIDPYSGARSVLSDFGDAGQGPLGGDPTGVALTASGQILVTDPNGGTGDRGALFRVDAGTGQRTFFTDFGANQQGVLGRDPTGIAITPQGRVFITDPEAGAPSLGGRFGQIFEVNPTTGAPSLFKDMSNLPFPEDSVGENPTAIAVNTDGTLEIGDGVRGEALIYYIDLQTRAIGPNIGRLWDSVGALGLVSSILPDGTGRVLVAIDGQIWRMTTMGAFATVYRRDGGSAIAFTRGNDLVELRPDGGTSGAGSMAVIAAAPQSRSNVNDLGDASAPVAVEPLGMAIDRRIRPVTTGDILTLGDSRLVALDPATGQRWILSQLSDPAQGETSAPPIGGGVEVGRDGTIYLASARFLMRVDPRTGNRTVITDFGARTYAGGLAVARDGQLVALVRDGAFASHATLQRIDPLTGNSAVITDFADRAQWQGTPPSGWGWDSPYQVAVGPDGRIFVSFSQQPVGGGGLIEVDATSGVRRVVQDFSDPNADPNVDTGPRGIAVQADGTVLAATSGAPSLQTVWRVNPDDNTFSVFSARHSGTPIYSGVDLLVMPAGLDAQRHVLVLASQRPGQAGIIRIDAATGAPASVTNFLNLREGPSLTFPTDFAVIPPANQVPVAVDDHYTAAQDTALAVPVTTGLLANDTDADGDLLFAGLEPGGGPSHGTVVVHRNGSLRYTPNAGYHGNDSFRYTVDDGLSTTTAVVRIVVAAPTEPTPTDTATATATATTTATAKTTATATATASKSARSTKPATAVPHGGGSPVNTVPTAANVDPGLAATGATPLPSVQLALALVCLGGICTCLGRRRLPSRRH